MQLDEQELEQEIEAVDEPQRGVEVSTETVLPTSPDTPATRQPETQRVNLDELPEFRKYRSETDKRMAAMERNYQQQLAQAQTEARQRQMAEMDEPERVAFERDEAIRAYNAAVAEKDQLLAERNRNLILTEVAAKYKVPREYLEAAESPDQARDLAWEWREKQLAEQAKQSEDAVRKRQEKREANKVDVGNGLPAPSLTDWEREEQKYIKSGDTAGLYKAALTWKP